MSVREEIIKGEENYILQTFKGARSPFVVEKGEGVYLYDTEGKRYLDFLAGLSVNAFGHNDPDITRAIEEQAKKVIHTTNLYYTIPQVELAKALVETSFADKVFLCNSGSEAVEGAIKFARKYMKVNFPEEERPEIIAFDNSFHGRTLGALAITSNEKYRKPFGPLMPGAKFARLNDIESVHKLMSASVSAIVVEPVQGEGGVYMSDKEFLKDLRRLADEHDALLVFDEIQCSLGRTGHLFSYEYYGVTPDILTIAKPLGGGLPIGAILMTEKIASTLEPGDHGGTFGGGPFVCHVAKTVFDKINNPKLLESVKDNGDYLFGKLRALKDKYSNLIVDVRGQGLMAAIEINAKAGDVITKGYERGIIVGSAGANVVRLLPPLIVNRDDIDMLLAELDPIFAEMN